MLRPLQNMFDPADHPDLLVGLGAPDDAAVYRLDAERALVVTTDFFTPIVDDPYHYGAIAAANALSDVYAMGGQPVLALNLAALPPDLPPEMMAAIIRGMAEKVREAGAVIAGGHTIQDKEPKVGLAVVGMASPDRLLTKSGAQAGDVLVLTKPLGTGCITTAAKRDLATAAHVQEAVELMMQLNKAAAAAALKAGARCATDITGFGLLGHATEMAQDGAVTLQFDFSAIPFLSGARDYIEQDIFPGGSANNKLAYEKGVRFDPSLTFADQMLLFDAQTSGGLLIALPAAALGVFAEEMQKQQAAWWKIGAVLPRQSTAIRVEP